MSTKDDLRLERDDSRGLDDELSPADQARVAREQAEDPARARGARRMRAALGLWAEDARLASDAYDPAAATRGVFARIAADPDGDTYAPPRASWSYVAAAAALLAVGMGGLWASWPGRSAAPQIPGVATDLEQDSLAVMRRVEIEAFSLVGSAEGR